ncbi:MAG TPA: glycogen debranching enzyme N-terminal domain-containing protein, partial [Chthonomonadaceae bacterium]|nr:glycogen debranching enzyme N-terminal domain-containing protein [Chthonomonadaceae bacterium]
MLVTIPADVLNDFGAACAREWLVTNGIGGYASGSLSGANTRRYHGLLVAALTPPTGRMTLLSQLDEALTFEDAVYELSANQYPGAIHPQGYRFLEKFEAYPVPTFTYRPRPDLLLEKRIWMAYGQNTTYIQYRLAEAPGPVALRLTPLVCWKSFHAEMHPWEGFPRSLSAGPGEMRMLATPDAPLLRLVAGKAGWQPAGYWHSNIEHERERERGLDWREDLYAPGHFQATLPPGDSLTLIATIERAAPTPEQARNAFLKRQQALLDRAQAADDYARALVLAADAFVIEGAKAGASGPKRSTLIAGYHWFSDWGRDTMISLPGLCLCTGRTEVARAILTSYAGFVSEGMLLNRFPDQGETPEYNTVDATLWYFQAIRAYCEQAPDGLELAHALWPVLKDILAWHVKGTRYGIKVDPADGLLHAGQPGVQLTWMDAKVGDWVVTPRIGKPVEVQALWINALWIANQFTSRWEDKLSHAVCSFRERFWNPERGFLNDVVDVNHQVGMIDATLRPNQIFAVGGLPLPLLEGELA